MSLPMCTLTFKGTGLDGRGNRGVAAGAVTRGAAGVGVNDGGTVLACPEVFDSEVVRAGVGSGVMVSEVVRSEVAGVGSDVVGSGVVGAGIGPEVVGSEVGGSKMIGAGVGSEEVGSEVAGS